MSAGLVLPRAVRGCGPVKSPMRRLELLMRWTDATPAAPAANALVSFSNAATVPPGAFPSSQRPMIVTCIWALFPTIRARMICSKSSLSHTATGNHYR
jgi:hypothetical protein